MSAPNTAAIREYIRWLFRVAPKSAEDRNALLDDLSDAAREAWQTGTALTSTGQSGGSSAGFALFKDWQPEKVLELIDLLRTAAAQAAVDAALTDTGTPVRSTHFQCGLER